jgi:hypothetical protein
LGENIKKFDKGLHLHLMARVDRKYFSLWSKLSVCDFCTNLV